MIKLAEIKESLIEMLNSSDTSNHELAWGIINKNKNKTTQNKEMGTWFLKYTCLMDNGDDLFPTPNDLNDRLLYSQYRENNFHILYFATIGRYSYTYRNKQSIIGDLKSRYCWKINYGLNNVKTVFPTFSSFYSFLKDNNFIQWKKLYMTAEIR